MAFKIDLTKAFDSLEWGFIRDTLLGFGFPHLLVKLIMSCISTSSIACLWNGEITQSFLPSRGIRQGDPICPYLFVLCLERLFRMINTVVADKHLLPLNSHL